MKKRKQTDYEQDLFFRSDNPDEVVYLLHFLNPLSRKNGVKVQHYLGFSKHIEKRLHAHTTGKNGSKLVAAVMAKTRCVSWVVARTWQANRKLERYLKDKKMNFARLCPICNGEHRRDLLTGDTPF